jgi:acyl-CoA synthetase (AMP-forming)/AMP-acid ligase II
MFLPVANFGSIEDLGLDLRWNARQLAQEVERRAAALAQIGVGDGALVAISHGGSAHFFADLLATWNVGAVAACLDPALTARERETIFSFARPAADFRAANDATSELVSELGPLSVSRDSGRQAELANAALVLFTSGTTGTPKGVVLRRDALQTRLALNRAAIDLRALARTLVTLPTHFGHGLIGNALTPLTAGGDIVLHPRGISLAQNLGALIDDYRITFLSSVPALWRMALKLGRAPAHASLLRVHVGSAPLSGRLWAEVAAWSRAEVVNCYGITETANWIAGASSVTDGITDGLVGRMWGGTARIKDHEGKIRSAGEGEIVVQTPSLMSGYLGRPELTAAVLRDGWYYTGDRGVIENDGQIRLTGRIKDEINRAGFKVQPAELDALLESHPAVAQACVFAMTDAVSGEIVAAAIKLGDDANETSEGLRAWCRERLRHEAVPERWFFVEDMPQSERGKLSRDAVRRHVLGAER